jgi:hypothetical protein
MTHAPLGMRTVRRTSEESGLVTSPEGEGEELSERGLRPLSVLTPPSLS